jgi:hypothetical protein
MIDLKNVPELRPLPRSRRDADEALLRSTVRSTPAARPRRRLLAVASVGAGTVLVVGGVAAAGSLLSARSADVHDSARCYSAVSSDFGDGFPGTTVALAATPGHPAADVPSQVLDLCSSVWAAGLLGPDGGQVSAAKDQKSGTLPTDGPVPALAACVLPSGEAAVFPGPPDTCASLGLAPLKAT